MTTTVTSLSLAKPASTSPIILILTLSDGRAEVFRVAPKIADRLLKDGVVASSEVRDYLNVTGAST